MKFYRDLFEASVSRVLSEANKKTFSWRFTRLLFTDRQRRSNTSPVARAKKVDR